MESQYRFTAFAPSPSQISNAMPKPAMRQAYFSPRHAHSRAYLARVLRREARAVHGWLGGTVIGPACRASEAVPLRHRWRKLTAAVRWIWRRSGRAWASCAAARGQKKAAKSEIRGSTTTCRLRCNGFYRGRPQHLQRSRLLLIISARKHQADSATPMTIRATQIATSVWYGVISFLTMQKRKLILSSKSFCVVVL